MGHHHQAEENPKVSSTAAFFFILIIAGLVLATINFVKSMSAAHHGDASHATATHGDEHSWHHPNQYNTAKMKGATQAEEATKTSTTMVMDTVHKAGNLQVTSGTDTTQAVAH